jgi:endonuclease-3 related protein
VKYGESVFVIEKEIISKDEIAFLIPQIYKLLHVRFGHRHWWPGDTRDEIMIGAILTQNTAWTNVEKAIKNLKKVDCLSLDRLASTSRSELEKMIRPSGYFRQKAERLMNFARIVLDYPDGPDAFFHHSQNLDEIRDRLLNINGVGPETADSILLYAASFPSFVIDAYTFRIFTRMALYDGKKDYMKLQKLITDNLELDLDLYRDYHAQLVELGKRYCRNRRPVCDTCPLNELCPKKGA